MDQLAINFDAPPAPDFAPAKHRARRNDAATSHEAAEKVTKSGTAAAHCELCLAAVRLEPGLTAVEIAKRIGIDRHAASRRLPELKGKGLVRTGESRVCSVNGTKQMTWWPA